MRTTTAGFAFCLALVLSIMGCGGNSQDNNSDATYQISGSVTTGESGLEGVLITLSGASEASVTTDSDGNFVFTGLPQGSYSMTPSMENYGFYPVMLEHTIGGSNIAVTFTGSPSSECH